MRHKIRSHRHHNVNRDDDDDDDDCDCYHDCCGGSFRKLTWCFCVTFLLLLCISLQRLISRRGGSSLFSLLPSRKVHAQDTIKYINYVCGRVKERDQFLHACGGLGDRWKGMVAVYSQAKRTNRTFRILWRKGGSTLKDLFTSDDDLFSKPSTYSCAPNYNSYKSFTIMDLQMIRNGMFDKSKEQCLEIRANRKPDWMSDDERERLSLELWKKLKPKPTFQKYLDANVPTEIEGCYQLRVGGQTSNFKEHHTFIDSKRVEDLYNLILSKVKQSIHNATVATAVTTAGTTVTMSDNVNVKNVNNNALRSTNSKSNSNSEDSDNQKKQLLKKRLKFHLWTDSDVFKNRFHRDVENLGGKGVDISGPLQHIDLTRRVTTAGLSVSAEVNIFVFSFAGPPTHTVYLLNIFSSFLPLVLT
jgi:hypothetical protein